MSDTSLRQLRSQHQVNPDIFELEMDGLVNGRAYCFAVRAVGERGRFTVSKPVMVIPGKPENTQPLFPGETVYAELGTWAPDEAAVAYMADYIWGDSQYLAKAVFTHHFATGEKKLIENNAYSPEWSPTGQYITYHTDNGEQIIPPGYMPAHIAVHRLSDGASWRLTSGGSFNYRPTWSPDGQWVAFLSDQANGDEYHIWKAPLDGGPAIQLNVDFGGLSGHFSQKSLRSPQKPAWSKDGQQIAFARKTRSGDGFVDDIYAIPASGGSKAPLITSPWNDHSPSWSPDGKSLAFVSDRSGRDQIWVQHLPTGKLLQITGSTMRNVYANWGKIEWSPSGSRILYSAFDEILPVLYWVELN
jgi:Tol biopolymer transport system component